MGEERHRRHYAMYESWFSKFCIVVTFALCQTFNVESWLFLKCKKENLSRRRTWFLMEFQYRSRDRRLGVINKFVALSGTFSSPSRRASAIYVEMSMATTHPSEIVHPASTLRGNESLKQVCRWRGRSSRKIFRSRHRRREKERHAGA